MTDVSFKHTKVSAVSDGGDTTYVRPSDWNAEHDVQFATGKLIGRQSTGEGTIEELTVGNGLTLASLSIDPSYASTAECITGTSTSKIVNPDGLQAKIDNDIEDGFYSPTIVNMGNTSGAVAAGSFYWCRYDDVVTVEGAVQLTAVANLTQTTVRFDPPVATTFGSQVLASGFVVGWTIDGTYGANFGYCFADTTYNDLSFSFYNQRGASDLNVYKFLIDYKVT